MIKFVPAMNIITTVVPLLGWFALWIAGGWLLVRGAFRVSPRERLPLALVTGLVVDTLLANLLSMALPLPAAVWTAALVTLGLGILAAWGLRWRDLLPWPLYPGQIAALALAFLVMFQIQRGLAIFDDYAHLPTVSIMATGDIPPHFPFDPNILYAYHYFVLLVAAQIMRAGGLEVWNALDAARSLAFALSAVLAGMWAERITRSRVAGMLGFIMAALGSGGRWLLLLLPAPVTAWLSQSVTLIGSGLQSGPTLAESLTHAWTIEGGPAMPYPFAFANGIYPAGVVAANLPISIMLTGILSALLLTYNRWRGWRGGAVSVFLLAATALLDEITLPLAIASWGLLAVLVMLSRRSARLPKSFWQWAVVVAAAVALGSVQGGALTDILAGWLKRLSGEAASSYQTVGFNISLVPAIVSSHLGVLYVTSPAQLIVGLFEIGPVLLALPLVVAWGVKLLRAGRWYEAAFIIAGLLSFGGLFAQFSGSTGVRNTPRLYAFVGTCALYAIPLVWLWASRRSQALQALAGVFFAALMLGGAVMFGSSLTAAQQPAPSYFITSLDARMYDRYWDRLEPGALVFDVNSHRATTLFGRATNSSYTWYQTKPEWAALRGEPDPTRLRAGGYRYLYLDNTYFNELSLPMRQRIDSGCARLIEEAASGTRFRRLYDLEGCR